MASVEEISSLRFFRPSEFKHPELMSFPFLKWMDRVRLEYGFPIIITSDGRTSAENDVLPGSSRTSRHLLGEAIDFEFPPTMQHVWLLVGAIMKCQTTRPIEIELVKDHHVHVAWLSVGRASSFIIGLP